MARQPAPATIIDVPTPTKGLRGRIERLFVEYNTKAQALRITAEILDDDDRKTAAVAAPAKFLKAINHRNGHAGRGPLLIAGRRGPVKKQKWPIHGKALTLFLLEKADDQDTRPVQYFMDQLAAAGTPVKSPRSLNGPGGVLTRFGFMKRTKDGFRRTAKGATHAEQLRARLEESGKVAKDGYMPA